MIFCSLGLVCKRNGIVDLCEIDEVLATLVLFKSFFLINVDNGNNVIPFNMKRE